VSITAVAAESIAAAAVSATAVAVESIAAAASSTLGLLVQAAATEAERLSLATTHKAKQDRWKQLTERLTRLMAAKETPEAEVFFKHDLHTWRITYAQGWVGGPFYATLWCEVYPGHRGVCIKATHRTGERDRLWNREDHFTDANLAAMEHICS
jgi:hypothetical protein